MATGYRSTVLSGSQPADALTRRSIGAASAIRTFRKIDFLVTRRAVTLLVEFVGEYLNLRTTGLAFAIERLQIPELFESWTMAHWGIGHVGTSCYG